MPLSAEDVLVIVDLQNDFVSGTMGVAGSEAIIGPVNALVASAGHVVVTMDWHPQDHISFASNHPGRVHGDMIEASYGPQKLFPDHCVQETWGAELDPRFALGKAELILKKGYRADLDSYSAFFWNDGRTTTGLAGYLRDRGMKRVFVAGITRLGCVLQTALGAAREGFEVALIDDASIGDAGKSEAVCLAMMRDAGVALVRADDVLKA